MRPNSGTVTAIARWVSIVGHPFAIVTLLVAVVASKQLPPTRALSAVAIVVLLVLLPLSVMIALQVRSGRWGNVDASDRRERPSFFLAAALVTVLAGMLFARMPGYAFLVRGACAMLALVTVAAIVNAHVKISLHVAVAAYAAIVLLDVAPAAGAATLVLIPALAWSRLSLLRHSPAEVILGGLAGAAVAMIARLP